MLSIVEVKCPHCGAEGRIILPPLGAIIIGPCPECQGMVAVFCGKVLPLDGEIMQRGSVPERKEHLMEVLGVFLHERIEHLFSQSADGFSPGEPGSEEPEFLPDSSGAGERQTAGVASQPISEEELKTFLNVDLRLIDNKDYFRSVFS